MRGLALDFGAGPANASDGNGLLPRLDSQMVASTSVPAESSGVTPTDSAKRMASAQRGWRPSSTWSGLLVYHVWSFSALSSVRCEVLQ